MPASRTSGAQPDVGMFNAWTSPVAIVDAIEPDQPIVYVNPAFCRLTGYAPADLLGRNRLLLQNEDQRQSGLDTLQRAVECGDGARAVIRSYRKDGDLFWNEVTLSPVADAAGTITHFIAIMLDVSAGQATTDDDTQHLAAGTPDRLLLSNRLQQAMLHADQLRSAAALVFLEVDHFKLVTDNKGSQVARELLAALTRRLNGCIRKADTVTICDQNEFAIVVNDVSGVRDVEAVLEKIRNALAMPFVIQGRKIHITCGSGVALYPHDAGDWQSLSRFAHMALFDAKQAGNGEVRFFSPAMNARVEERENLEVALRLALANDTLQLHYQPVVSLQTGAVLSLEALIRWTHPVMGVISPVRFIPIAEEADLIDAVGEWVIGRACADMRRRLDEGLRPLRVAVNVSPRQFLSPRLADLIEDALASHRLDPRLLCLEITEGAVMQDTEMSKATLGRLKLLGIDLLLDDFGTGFSSLSYLKRFPFDRVKIDRSFITDLVSDSDDAAITKAIISMAHSLGIRVIAEGVETEEQCTFLRDQQCDEMQGFLFSPGIPSDQLAQLLRDGRGLPAHLLRAGEPPRTLLLVDDEPEALDALKRLLRRDNYEILVANSGEQGLKVLAQHAVDVIMCDQGMPGMSGVDFLYKACALYPDTVRIVLSGFSELQSVSDAVNEGTVYKFLTKPWEDAQLRAQVEEAFHRKELADINRRLNDEIRSVNLGMAVANRQLQELLDLKKEQLQRDHTSLELQRTPAREEIVRIVLPDQPGDRPQLR